MSPLTDVKIVQTSLNNVFNDFFVEAGWGKKTSIANDSKAIKGGENVKETKLPLIYSKTFFDICTVIRDPKLLKKSQHSADLLPVKNNENNLLSPLEIPFSLDLPENFNFPQTIKDTKASIEYSLKLTMSWQGNSFKKNLFETMIDVTVLFPDWARTKLLSEESPLSHHLPFSAGKCDVHLDIPKRILCPTEYLAAEVFIKSIPIGRTLRYVDVSLRSTFELKGPHGIKAVVHFGRPLSEDRDIPQCLVEGKRVSVTKNWKKSFKLLVDGTLKTLAVPTVTSQLFSIKTVFRLEIVLDDNPIPNVIVEFPVTILPLQENEVFSFDRSEEGSLSSGTLNDSITIPNYNLNGKNKGSEITKIQNHSHNRQFRSRSSSPVKNNYSSACNFLPNDNPHVSITDQSLYSSRSSVVDLSSPVFPDNKTRQREIMEDIYSNELPLFHKRGRRPSLAEQKLDDLMLDILPEIGEVRRRSLDVNYSHSYYNQDLKMKFNSNKRKNIDVEESEEFKEERTLGAINEEKNVNCNITTGAPFLQYKAIHAYEPKEYDELELVPGDKIAVKRSYADGWAWGYNLTSMMEGAIPISTMCVPIY
ncbi:hypothetical protein HDU92_009132 [Lobulomyces angularis]|nr:hypothetical protein HDU92_009132 [Lobulomyces angularis]